MGCMQSLALGSLRISSWKGLARRSPPAVMDSAPTARPHSMLPMLIWLAMSWTALRPEEQKRLTDEAPAVVEYPALHRSSQIMPKSV